MTKAILTKKMFDIKNGEVYKAYINQGNYFTIALITQNGETTTYYTADLIESAEEWNEGNYQLEVVGDDFKIENLKDYETVEYEGKQYILTEEAEISHSTKIRIGDSILCLEGTIYEAPCIDEQGNEYTAYWVADENAAMPEEACNWDKPDYIEKA
jgi:hypothetical protein